MDYTDVLGFIVTDYRYNVTLEFWCEEDYALYMRDHHDRIGSEGIRADGYVEATLTA